MRPAYYMKFIEGHHGAFDRIGGVPSHLPPMPSICPDSGRERAFLAQIYSCPKRLELEGILCLHLYQDLGEGEPCPVVVSVPIGAKRNEEGLGIVKPGVRLLDTDWEYREDPDPDQVTTYDTDLGLSKCGGTTYFRRTVREADQFVLQLREYPAELNWA
jgi:hypothetical protein